MSDLIVIGAGYWGSAIARAARMRSYSVDMFADPTDYGASAMSAGFVRWEWLEKGPQSRIVPEWWTSRHRLASQSLLDEAGARLVAEAWSSYRDPETVRERPGLLLADPWRVLELGEPTHYKRVNLVRRASPWTGHGDGWYILPSHHWSQRVVIAAGVGTDLILARSGLPELGVTALAGAAFIATGDQAEEVRTFLTRPYHHVSSRHWHPGELRIGDTVGAGEERVVELLRDAKRLLPETRLLSLSEGHRPVLPQATVAEIAQGLVVATGGGRIGLALAGGVADRALELLGL